MTVNPYESPKDVAPPIVAVSPAVVRMPFWGWRLLLGLAGLILAADALAKIRPELSPAWFRGFAGVAEAIIGGFFLLAATAARIHETKYKTIPN